MGLISVGLQIYSEAQNVTFADIDVVLLKLCSLSVAVEMAHISARVHLIVSTDWRVGRAKLSVCWPTGLLQVLLPLLLALAALHGHPEQPPAPHAQPEEPGLQLEPDTSGNRQRAGGRAPLTSLWGQAARRGEHGALRPLRHEGRCGTPTRHWGISL